MRYSVTSGIYTFTYSLLETYISSNKANPEQRQHNNNNLARRRYKLPTLANFVGVDCAPPHPHPHRDLNYQMIMDLVLNQRSNREKFASCVEDGDAPIVVLAGKLAPDIVVYFHFLFPHNEYHFSISSNLN